MINNDERLEKEIKNRIGQERKEFPIKGKLLTLRNLDLRTRKRLIKT